MILERNGIKIGFLGYCDIISKNKNCTEIRMLFSSGPAIYRDDIATRDVNKLKQVLLRFILNIKLCTVQTSVRNTFLVEILRVRFSRHFIDVPSVVIHLSSTLEL